jgi:hypothetical protein
MPTLTWVGKDNVVNHHLMFHFMFFGMEAFEAPEGTHKIASAPHNHL